MSTFFLIGAFAYLVLPLLIASIVIAVAEGISTRERRLEVFMIYMFAFSGASGIAGALAPLLRLRRGG
jgi:hypothetical protein